MLLAIVYVILGATLVVWGADKMTDGASALARRIGVSELVVGLTVVSIGTSLPEFVVSLFAAIDHMPDMSVGNVVGSNLFNVLVIVGVCTLLCPMKVSKSTLWKDIPFVILSSLVLAFSSLDAYFDAGAPNVITRADGLIMLLFMLVFMFYTLSIAKEPKADEDEKIMSLPLSFMWIVVGISSLVFGGHIFVDGATEVAHELGVSELIIGMTVLAAGTSMPELAASAIAAYKGHSSMAIGNVIGSNVFNVFMVLGTCSIITPIHAVSMTWLDVAMLVVSCLLFWLFARTHFAIKRWEGIVLVLLYIVYMTYKICVA